MEHIQHSSRPAVTSPSLDWIQQAQEKSKKVEEKLSNLISQK
jgi:hypothetical protein